MAARLHLLCPVCGRRFRALSHGGRWFCGAGHEAPASYYALRPAAVAPERADALPLPRTGRDDGTEPAP